MPGPAPAWLSPARLAPAIATGLLVAALLAAGTGALAQAPAPEGAVQTAHEAVDADSYALPVGRFGAERRPVRRVEGAVNRTAWRLDDPRAGVAGVMAGYRERLGEQDFQPVWQCEGEGCGGFDFRFGAEIMAPPAMLVDVRDFAQLSARRAEPEAFVSVLVSRVLDAIHIQTVTVAASGAAPVVGPPDPPDPPDPPVPAEPADPLELAPGAASSAALPKGDAAALLAALERDGHVAVPGLEFETGTVRLSPGSAAALDALARMLAGEDAPGVLIVGHSDNEGPLDLNIDLSRQRAEQVLQALVERGVPAGRLEAHGAGFLAPVDSNATEAGRAANRRVELVLR